MHSYFLELNIVNIKKMPFLLNKKALIAFVLILISRLSECENMDLKNFKVWGPGLKPNFDFPVRYFFIQAVDNNHK
jgi:hypothetical protein